MLILTKALRRQHLLEFFVVRVAHCHERTQFFRTPLVVFILIPIIGTSEALGRVIILYLALALGLHRF